MRVLGISLVVVLVSGSVVPAVFTRVERTAPLGRPVSMWPKDGLVLVGATDTGAAASANAGFSDIDLRDAVAVATVQDHLAVIQLGTVPKVTHKRRLTLGTHTKHVGIA